MNKNRITFLIAYHVRLSSFCRKAQQVRRGRGLQCSTPTCVSSNNVQEQRKKVLLSYLLNYKGLLSAKLIRLKFVRVINYITIYLYILLNTTQMQNCFSNTFNLKDYREAIESLLRTSKLYSKD